MNIFFCTGNKGKISEFKQLVPKINYVYGVPEVEKKFSDNYLEPNENSSYFLPNGFIKIYSAMQFVFRHSDKNLLEIEKIVVDDSGLCVPELNFLPGAHSALYAGEPRDEKRNRLKLLGEIQHSLKSYQYKDENRMSGFFICFLFSVSLKNNFTFINKFSFPDAKSFVNKKLIALENFFMTEIDFKKAGGCFSKKVPFSDFNSSLPSDSFLRIDCGYCTGEVSTLEQSLITGAGHGYDSLFYGKQNRELSFASIPAEQKNTWSHRGYAVKAFLQG